MELFTVILKTSQTKQYRTLPGTFRWLLAAFRRVSVQMKLVPAGCRTECRRFKAAPAPAVSAVWQCRNPAATNSYGTVSFQSACCKAPYQCGVFCCRNIPRGQLRSPLFPQGESSAG